MIIAEDAPPGSAEEGENYFVSMTDMMIGILFIFIIMLMVFALSFRSSTDAQEEALRIAQEVARKLEVLRKNIHEKIADLDKAERIKRQLLEDIKEQLLAEGLNVEIVEASGVLRLTEELVRFAFDSSVLTETNHARSNVGKIAQVLARVLPSYACRATDTPQMCAEASRATIETLFIEGHTDARGGKARNWLLSTERAVNTYVATLSDAPSLSSLKNREGKEILSVSAYSSSRPIDPTETDEAYARNRRIDLRFVMEVDSRGQLLNILSVTDDMQAEIDRLRRVSGD